MRICFGHREAGDSRGFGFGGGRALPAARPTMPRGFTLTELLLVMGIIVLVLALAVPAIRALTGTNSQAAAQNQLSAFLGRVRTEAIGLQRVQGVMFFIDPASDRVAGAQVQAASGVGLGNVPGAVYLDLVPDRDVFYLPIGIRLQTINDSTFGPYHNDRYLGFNPVPGAAGQVKVGGVILFDGSGRTIAYPYGLRCVDPSSNAKTQTGMGQLLQLNADWPKASGANPLLVVPRSQLALVLLDREAFVGQGFTDADAQPNEAAEESWIDANATTILINRYNGTLIRGE